MVSGAALLVAIPCMLYPLPPSTHFCACRWPHAYPYSYPCPDLHPRFLHLKTMQCISRTRGRRRSSAPMTDAPESSKSVTGRGAQYVNDSPMDGRLRQSLPVDSEIMAVGEVSACPSTPPSNMRGRITSGLPRPAVSAWFDLGVFSACNGPEQLLRGDFGPAPKLHTRDYSLSKVCL